MKRAAGLAIAAVAAAWGSVWTAPAGANLIIQYQINSGSLQTLTDLDPTANSAFGTVHSGNLTLSLAGLSSAPGSTDLATLQGVAVSITNSGTATATVKVLIGDTGFTAPTAPPDIDLSSQIGGTTITGAATGAISFRSCIDSGNAQNNCPGTTSTAFLSHALTNSNSSWSASNTGQIASLLGPYSITEEFDLTIGNHANFNYSASTALVSVPEPASLFVLGASLIGLGVVARRRRVL